MYLQHFGLRSMPFEQTVNGRLYIDLPAHREALNTILFGLRSGEGFIKVVGEVGTGKTALCRNLLTRLEAEYVTAYLPNPAIRPLDLLLAVADQLGVPLPPKSSMHIAHKYTREILLDIARRGGHFAVFVDEAQTMPHATLESLRLLSNLESHRGKLVQVVLFGQPELDERLGHYSLRQLQQRISFSARLEPLDRKTCRSYIHRRLVHSGMSTKRIFTPAAVESIHRNSGGIPRLINVLCHKSLIAAFIDGEFQVARRHVSRATSDTEGLKRWQRRPLRRQEHAKHVGSIGSTASWRNFLG
ncbi:MAG: AAA family ATPase [Deltaproteobacteria bacterium]|nr:AAA family ATPase [Deltaproteobacteria bacterium]